MIYISYGAGVQSTALLICSNLGLHGIPRADVAIFADTQDEPIWVYETLERMREWSDIPVEVASKGHLLGLSKKRGFAGVPLFTPPRAGERQEGRLRRQCTREFKISVIEKRVRRLMGYKPRQQIKETATAMIGISVDEAHRMKPSRTRWITNTWPLVGARLRRENCSRINQEVLGFEPKRSSCRYCPYHSDKYWLDMKANHPDEFELACRADDALRDMTPSGESWPAYVHRSLVPLRVAVFRHENQKDLFGEECEGMCGV